MPIRDIYILLLIRINVMINSQMRPNIDNLDLQMKDSEM